MQEAKKRGLVQDRLLAATYPRQHWIEQRQPVLQLTKEQVETSVPDCLYYLARFKDHEVVLMKTETCQRWLRDGGPCLIKYKRGVTLPAIAEETEPATE